MLAIISMAIIILLRNSCIMEFKSHQTEHYLADYRLSYRDRYNNYETKYIDRANHKRCHPDKPLNIKQCLSTPTCGIYYSDNIEDGMCLRGTPEGPNITMPGGMIYDKTSPYNTNKNYNQDIYNLPRWIYSEPNLDPYSC
jgi:hypothetical protein